MAQTQSTKPATESSASPEVPITNRQSQLATILIGLLIIGSGLLIYNFFHASQAPVAIQPTPTPLTQATKPSVTPALIPNPSPSQPLNRHQAQINGQYLVVTGDSLWTISEKEYGDGFAWKTIEKANKLSQDANGQPEISDGQVLVIPYSTSTTSNQTPAIAASNQLPQTAIQTYVVQRGDTLWSVAHQFYGDGHRWTAIMNDPHNQLSSMADGTILVHAGNELYIPDLSPTP